MFTVFFQGHFYYKADEICILIHLFQFFKIKCCQHVSVRGSDSADEMGQSSLNIWSKAAICNPPRPLWDSVLPLKPGLKKVLFNAGY